MGVRKQWGGRVSGPEEDVDNFRAIGIAEGFVEAENEDQVIEAWQHLVETGLAWNLQGWFGRTAKHLIQEGVINPPDFIV